MVKVRGLLLVGLDSEERHGVSIEAFREVVDHEILVFRVARKLMAVRFDEVWSNEKLEPWLANGLKTEE